MRPADKMRRLFDEAAVQTNAAPDDAVFEKIKTVYTRTVERQSAQRKPSVWRFIMKSPITKLAAAAVVLIACGISLFLWRTTGSGIALAEVLARLEQAKASRWKGEGTVAREAAPGRPERLETFTTTTVISQEWGRRINQGQVDPNGGRTPLLDTYFLPQKKTFVQIHHSPKRYTCEELEDATVQRMQAKLVEYGDPGWVLKEIAKCKYESLGRSTVDGMAVEGYRTTDPNFNRENSDLTFSQVDAKLWVDVKTRMPVRVELFASGVNKTEGKENRHLVLHDFQWDGSVTAADFEPPPVPDGYLVVLDKLPGPITEDGAIQGLRQCVEWLGKYPGSIREPPWGIQSELDGSDSPAAVRLKEELKGLTEQDRINRLMEAGTPLRRVHRFFRTLNADKKDAAYYGKTVAPKDADKVLLRWKVSDGEYRVIFGDLHAETVSPEKLAELEKALSR